MRRHLSLLACLWLPAVSLAADGWGVTTPERATRRVVITVSFEGREVDRWVFPVGKNAPGVQDPIQQRWIQFPSKPEQLPKKIFADTWLGSVIEADVYVRFMWWADDQRQNRIASQYVPVSYGSHETVEFVKGVTMRCSYEPKT